MRPHRFQPGQNIVLSTGKYGAAPAGDYTVVRLLPNDGADREYRVRSRFDGHERVVRESELRGADETGAAKLN